MNRREFAYQYERINRKFEVKFFPLVKKAIHFKVKRVQSILKSDGYNAAFNHLNTDIANNAMTTVITKLYRIVGTKHAQLNYSRLQLERRKFKAGHTDLQTKGFGFNQEWSNFIINYLKRHLLEKVTFDINSTTRDALLRALTVMQLDGLGVDQAIEKLEEWPFEESQAARIVRTEVNTAANTGAKAQAETDPYQQVKEWISIHDNRTRGNPINGKKDHANHWALNGIKIDEYDVFVDPRNGDRLDFPGDPKASAASIINCRCCVSYTYKRDINGNLIPKRKTTTVIYPGQIRRDTPILTI
jgi:hypothetical protein